MPIQTDIQVVIDKYTQLNQATNLVQNQQDIQSFPALLSVAINYHLGTVLQALSNLTTLEDQALLHAFDGLLKKQWEMTQGTAFDIFNGANNTTNSCLKEVTKIIYPNVTDEELLLKFAPGIKKIITAALVKPSGGKLDVELKTENIAPSALEELLPADFIVVDDMILSVTSLIPFFVKLDYAKKIRAALEQNYPTVYAELIQKRNDVRRVFDVLKQQIPPPREAINYLMQTLKYSGTRFSGQELAGKMAEKAIARFQEYMDSLPALLKEQVYALDSGGGFHTIKHIIEHDLVQKGDCVETAASNLGKILENSANTVVLDTKPPQPTEDAIKKSFIKARKPFEVDDYNYPLESSVKIPPAIADSLLSKIRIQDEAHLIEFLRNLDIEYFAKLSLEQLNNFINDAEKFQYVLMHLDFLKQQAFCQFAAANLALFSSEKCIEVLKKARPDQGALILSAMNKKPIDFLNRWEYRRMLFTKENATHYLRGLGSEFLKSTIKSSADFWEWEKHLPSREAINVFLEALSIDHIKGLIHTTSEWLFVYERLTPTYQKQLIAKTDKAILNDPVISNKIADVNSVSLSSPGLFNPAIVKETLEEHLEIERFIQHVILGEQEEATAMVEAKPELLLMKGEVTDYSGRKIQGSAYQLALGADDVDMAIMLAPHFAKLKDHPGEKEKIEKTFQDELKHEDARMKNDNKALHDVVNAIANSQSDDDCKDALQTFRNYLSLKETITGGKHFNIQLLIDAFNLYDKKYDNFGGWDSRKNNLFWRNVIGYIQRYLPTCYAQAFCRGLYAIVNGKESLRRSLEFRDHPGYFFFPLSASSGLESGYAADSVGVRASVWRLDVSLLASWLESYMEQNQQRYKSLCNVQTIGRAVP